jgi:hypothetical protein
MEMIHVNITKEDKETLRRARRLVLRNEASRNEFDRWMAGDNGPVLFARHVDRGSATWTFHATLEFTEPFMKFLAALGARNLDGHVP